MGKTISLLKYWFYAKVKLFDCHIYIALIVNILCRRCVWSLGNVRELGRKHDEVWARWFFGVCGRNGGRERLPLALFPRPPLPSSPRPPQPLPNCPLPCLVPLVLHLLACSLVLCCALVSDLVFIALVFCRDFLILPYPCAFCPLAIVALFAFCPCFAEIF